MPNLEASTTNVAAGIDFVLFALLKEIVIFCAAMPEYVLLAMRSSEVAPMFLL